MGFSEGPVKQCMQKALSMKPGPWSGVAATDGHRCLCSTVARPGCSAGLGSGSWFAGPSRFSTESSLTRSSSVLGKAGIWSPQDQLMRNSRVKGKRLKMPLEMKMLPTHPRKMLRPGLSVSRPAAALSLCLAHSAGFWQCVPPVRPLQPGGLQPCKVGKSLPAL